ncbi:hypothetical protein A5740_18435 [Mycobacterium sp. GA-1841]|nr:hypothetical protein A5740_18435 [Mycobacterium sp. GA-1841]
MAGAGGAYGPPAHTGSIGEEMHAESDGPVGAPNPLSAHSARNGSAAQFGSSELGFAFAGAATPMAAIPINTAATAILIFAPHAKADGCTTNLGAGMYSKFPPSLNN